MQIKRSDVPRAVTAAAWRFDPEDQLPTGRQAAREILAALRAGPPNPPLGTITDLN
jgi:hypothetical protein